MDSRRGNRAFRRVHAELGAAFLKAGGPYVYLSRGLSPLFGFLFGWMSSFLDRPVAIHIPRGTIRIYFYDGTAAGSVGGSGGDGSELLERASGWSDPVATDVAEDSDNPGDCAGGRVFRKTPCVRSGNSGGAGWIGDNRRVIDGAGSSDASLQRFQ